MDTIQKHFKIGLGPVLAAFIITTIMPGLPTEAQAGEGAAFLGGMVAGHIVGGAVRRSKIRTAAAVQAANQPKDRLKELDKLAAGGYITPEEYKAKKKAILDSI
jgi:hypothetical protein